MSSREELPDEGGPDEERPDEDPQNGGEDPCPDCGETHGPGLPPEAMLMSSLGSMFGSPPVQQHHHHSDQGGVPPQIAVMMARGAERARMLEQAVQLIAIFRHVPNSLGGGLPASSPTNELTGQEKSAYNAALMYTSRVFNTEDINPSGTLVMGGPPSQEGPDDLQGTLDLYPLPR